jgi:hypothetical protein
MQGVIICVMTMRSNFLGLNIFTFRPFDVRNELLQIILFRQLILIQVLKSGCLVYSIGHCSAHTVDLPIPNNASHVKRG